jgi:hypothetical protein
MKVIQILVALAAVWVSATSAQTLTSIQVEPAQVTVGQSVKLTAALDVKDGAVNCGLLLVWGDGATSYEKISKERDIPFSKSHTYTKPGTYTVAVEPTKAGSALKCNGKDQKTTLVVAAAPVAAVPVVAAPVAAAPAPAVVAAAPAVVAAAPAAVEVAEQKTVDTCPKGWKLGKSGIKPNGAFTCTAPKKTKVPKEEIMCVEKLKYFADSKSGQLGCR